MAGAWRGSKWEKEEMEREWRGARDGEVTEKTYAIVNFDYYFLTVKHVSFLLRCYSL